MFQSTNAVLFFKRQDSLDNKEGAGVEETLPLFYCVGAVRHCEVGSRRLG